jgi:hypothetical protein
MTRAVAVGGLLRLVMLPLAHVEQKPDVWSWDGELQDPG